MKFLLSVFAVSVCLIFSFTTELKAQVPEGMKYQAVARDASGNVKANESMTVRIGIYESAGAAIKVYEETQNVTTNQFGLFNLNIGEGSATFGTFSSVDWGNDEHHLKVEINTGSGFVDMGTNQLQSVPYSLFAKEAGSIGNMGIGELADVDVTGVSNNQVLKWNGSTWVPATDNSGGSYTAGTGLNLSGTTFDAQNTVPIWNADQLQGSNISASTPSMGDILQWNGSEWMPQVNTDTSYWHKNSNKVYTITDSVGIGTNNPLARLHVNTGGNVLFGDTSIPTGILASKPYFMWVSDEGALRAGEVSNSKWHPDSLADASVAFGWNSEASAVAAFAAGFSTEASGGSSSALGFSSTASGSSSTALGNNTTASGNRSTTMGDNTTASGNSSTAMGDNTTAAGNRSIAMGHSTTASSGYETVLGRFNTNYTPNDSSGWDPDDRLFSIGNGTSSGSNRSDAIVVLKNGNVGIGTSTPSATLEVDGDSSVFITSASDYISIKSYAGEPSLIPYGPFSGNGFVGNTNFPFYRVYSERFYASGSGNYLSYSDKTIKENIDDIDKPLDGIMSLKGVTYDLKKEFVGNTRDPENRFDQIGFVAQEVEKVFPQLVQTNEDSGLKAVGYMGLIPVMVEAIKEQQSTIESQQKENEKLEEKVDLLEKRLLEMEKRLEQLEQG